MSAQAGKSSDQGRRPPQGRAALDPTTPSLTQPWKRLVEEGFIQKMSIEFTPTGSTVVCIPDARVIAVEGSGLEEGVTYPIGMVKAAVDKGNLIPRRQDKKKSADGKAADTPKPAKTLVKSDFGGSAAELFARAKAVAQSCGGATLVGRVRSAGVFDGEVTTSFQDWWAAASPEKRGRSLVQPRHAGELTREDVAKFANMECPFRGTAEFVVADGGDEDQVA